MKERIEKAINDQIQAEFESAYIYLAMSSFMESRNLSGFANWLHIQWQEETLHAMKLRDFVLQRGGNVALQSIPAPKSEWKSPVDVFSEVLEHEKYITSRIHDLYALAVEEKDYALQTLMHWYIDEQVEEEDNVNAVLDQLKMIGDSGPNLFLLDRELGQRAPENADA